LKDLGNPRFLGLALGVRIHAECTLNLERKGKIILKIHLLFLQHGTKYITHKILSWSTHSYLCNLNFTFCSACYLGKVHRLPSHALTDICIAPFKDGGVKLLFLLQLKNAFKPKLYLIICLNNLSLYYKLNSNFIF